MSVAACSITTPDTGPAPPAEPTTMPPPPAPAPSVVAKPAPPPPAPAEATFDEVVNVLMKDKRRSTWFCTGTLISSTEVVTAAHCLDASMFVSYQIVTRGGARVAASRPSVVSADVEDVANPDMGVLRLDAPVELARYAALADVSARVDAGQVVTAAAFVRTAERPDAPFAWSEAMTVSSTVDLGYVHGFGTPMFSKGGDSGAGLFLVKDGKPTHELIGVARQPDPARELDHFSRVDASFLAWRAAR